MSQADRKKPWKVQSSTIKDRKKPCHRDVELLLGRGRCSSRREGPFCGGRRDRVEGGLHATHGDWEYREEVKKRLLTSNNSTRKPVPTVQTHAITTSGAIYLNLAGIWLKLL